MWSLYHPAAQQAADLARCLYGNKSTAVRCGIDVHRVA